MCFDQNSIPAHDLAAATAISVSDWLITKLCPGFSRSKDSHSKTETQSYFIMEYNAGQFSDVSLAGEELSS